jgi:hypothetical protein
MEALLDQSDRLPSEERKKPRHTPGLLIQPPDVVNARDVSREQGEKDQDEKSCVTHSSRLPDHHAPKKNPIHITIEISP